MLAQTKRSDLPSCVIAEHRTREEFREAEIEPLVPSGNAAYANC